jgi:hypothetical protein
MLDTPGLVGRRAVSAMVRLSRCSKVCHDAVLDVATARQE